LAHTFLFNEGVWRAEGEFRDGSGTASAVGGETIVRHEPGKWLYEGVLRVKGAQSEYRNRYEIQPFSPGALSTHWTSHNPTVGALRGRFVISGDSILSFYESPTGRYRGFECVQQRDATCYSARGALLEEDKVLSTWAIELTML
jgi:hypothetical protein